MPYGQNETAGRPKLTRIARRPVVSFTTIARGPYVLRPQRDCIPKELRPPRTYALSHYCWRRNCYSLTVPKVSSECAIMMEIWASGAILQTDCAIPEDTTLTIVAPGGPVPAKVSTCTQDDYGFLAAVYVDCAEPWFPN